MDTMRLVATLVAFGALVTAAPACAQGMALGPVDARDGLVIDNAPLLALDKLWVATDAWQGLYRFPGGVSPSLEEIQGGQRLAREQKGSHGQIRETVTTGQDSVTVRYDFSFDPMEGARYIQWVLRLEPERFDGSIVSGEGVTVVSARPIAGAMIGGLKTLHITHPAMDLSFTVSASEGEWQFSDARAHAWAHCYRLEYNRDFVQDGKRSGWVEMTVRGKRAAETLIPLSTGPEADAGGIPFRLGPPVAEVGRKLSGLIAWQTADGPARSAEPVGQIQVLYADGTPETMQLRWEREVASPGDDPRDLRNAALRPLPDGTAAWLSVWQNPYPEREIASVGVESLDAGWRLCGLVGVAESVGPERLAAIRLMARGGKAMPEEVVTSLDGTWRFEPAGGKAQDIPVPARWETIGGLRDVHEGTYQREFDIDPEYSGQRIFVRFDAIGEFAEVRVNGRYAGQALAGPLPVEFDISGLVNAPSEGNVLTVAVKDDTHFSTPRPTTDWRDRRHWIPHGIGGNNRKGLFQSVALCGRPPVHVSDVRVQTSVREKKLTAICEVFNTGKDTVTATIGASVRPYGGGEVELDIPAAEIELPGQVRTTVTLSAEWDAPRLWQPNHPNLYELRTVLTDSAGRRLNRRDDRFGFREVWFEGIHFYFNGIRCNLRGESPSYAQAEGPFETRSGTVEAVRKCLAANFNVLRFHAAPAPPHVYEVCDEMGMMVIDESAIYASWAMVMPEHARWLPECRQHLARWVQRDRNHPSIVLWSAENEGLNVNQLSAAQLAEFREEIDANDGTRPVIFDGDGTGFGASPASVKHYVRTIDDLKHRGGRSSGYGSDLRNDIYWASEYKQDVPLGVGEFLFPANDSMREKNREVCAMMGLQTRGYRYADWFDIRPYNPHYVGFLDRGGLKEGYEDVWDIIVKSFAPVAVFDKEYDALGPFPEPPVIKANEAQTRTLIVYNDTFEDEAVTVDWAVSLDGKRIAGESRQLEIPLGGREEFQITFTAPEAGQIEVALVSTKGGAEQFRDVRSFVAQ